MLDYRYLLRVDLPHHHFHEVLVRYGKGHVSLAAVWTLVECTTSCLQINSCIGK